MRPDKLRALLRALPEASPAHDLHLAFSAAATTLMRISHPLSEAEAVEQFTRAGERLARALALEHCDGSGAAAAQIEGQVAMARALFSTRRRRGNAK